MNQRIVSLTKGRRPNFPMPLPLAAVHQLISVEYRYSHLVVFCDDNVIPVNLDNLVNGEGLGECTTIDRYLLMIYIYQQQV